MLRKTPPIAFPIELRDILGIIKRLDYSDSLTEFERCFANAFDLDDCFAVSSGKSALTLALMALKDSAPNRTEVIIPAYTCPTVALSVVRAGLKVKLCDISIDTLNIDISLLNQVVDENTLCIIAVHAFGFPCDMDSIYKIINDNGCYLVEDVAQSAGAKWNGHEIGSLGHLSCFSLGRGKSFTTYEGGVLGIGNASESIKKSLKSLSAPLKSPSISYSLRILFQLTCMSYLQNPHAWWLISKLPLGFDNQYHSIDFPIRRLGKWQASLGLSVLQRLDSINAIRIKNGMYLTQQLQNMENIAIPKTLDGAEPVYLRLPIIAKSRQIREEIYHKLNYVGIGVSRMYTNPLHRYDYLKDIVPDGNYPIAEYVADRILALPTHPLMRERDLQKIVEVLRSIKE